MKINVVFTIEVDPATWNTSYGSGTSAAEVRADVREYVFNQVQQSPGMLEVDAVVAVR